MTSRYQTVGEGSLFTERAGRIELFRQAGRKVEIRKGADNPLIYQSRGWFIMLTASILLFFRLALALSPSVRNKLGHQDDEPEFSARSWLTTMSAAGIGVGSAGPIALALFAMDYRGKEQAASTAMFVTIFHRGPFT